MSEKITQRWLKMEIFLNKVKKKSSNELGHLENFIWSETMH